MPVDKKKKDMAGEFAKKILVTLVGILLAYAIVLFGTMIRNNLQEYRSIGFADKAERLLTVDAEAKVTAVPDIAVIAMGVILKGETVADAQKKSSETMNALVEKLKDLGVESGDIQTTGYTIYPKIKYTPNKGEEADGYEVNQSVTITVRNLDNAGAVLSLAGEVGANSVQGVEFRIDDRDVYRKEARDAALVKVSEKAKGLSRALGVRLVSVVSYNEYEPTEGPNFGPVYERGLGGGGALPSFERGSTDVVMHVTVTFEIH